MASVFPKLCTLVSHNRRQRPHSRRMPSRVRFCPNFAPRATDAGYGRLCIVGGGFRLDAQQFHLLRSTKPLHSQISNPFAISRLTWCAEISLATEG
ncbi:MAG: hypothetical protein IPL33_22480 [Sphingobacteriales bacterium]|nr:hypothetical protein [Sphingobacteriales bacterium]